MIIGCMNQEIGFGCSKQSALPSVVFSFFHRKLLFFSLILVPVTSCLIVDSSGVKTDWEIA